METMYEELVTLAFEAGYLTGRTFLTRAEEEVGKGRFIKALQTFINDWDPVGAQHLDYVLKNPHNFTGEDARFAVRELFERVL